MIKFCGTNKKLNEFRKYALNNRTKAELWAEQILFSKFDRSLIHIEFVYGFRRFDFYIPKIRTVIEIDGGYHRTKEQKQKDLENDNYLFRRRGIKVFRVNNFDIFQMTYVCNQIEDKLSKKDIKPPKIEIIKQNKKKLKLKQLRLERVKKYEEDKKKWLELKANQPKIILRKKKVL